MINNTLFINVAWNKIANIAITVTSSDEELRIPFYLYPTRKSPQPFMTCANKTPKPIKSRKQALNLIKKLKIPNSLSHLSKLQFEELLTWFHDPQYVSPQYKHLVITFDDPQYNPNAKRIFWNKYLTIAEIQDIDEIIQTEYFRKTILK